MTINDEHLDNLLLAAAPFTNDQLAGLSYGGAPRPARLSSRRLIRGGVGLCLSVAAAVMAAAAIFTSHAGIFYNGGENGHGENLVLRASDIVDVYRKHLADYPLPRQGAWDKLLYRAAHPRSVVEMVSRATEEVVEGWVAFESRCQWQKYWITSHTANARNVLGQRTTNTRRPLLLPRFTGSPAHCVQL